MRRLMIERAAGEGGHALGLKLVEQRRPLAYVKILHLENCDCELENSELQWQLPPAQVTGDPFSLSRCSKTDWSQRY